MNSSKFTYLLFCLTFLVLVNTAFAVDASPYNQFLFSDIANQDNCDRIADKLVKLAPELGILIVDLDWRGDIDWCTLRHSRKRRVRQQADEVDIYLNMIESLCEEDVDTRK